MVKYSFLVWRGCTQGRDRAHKVLQYHRNITTRVRTDNELIFSWFSYLDILCPSPRSLQRYLSIVARSTQKWISEAGFGTRYFVQRLEPLVLFGTESTTLTLLCRAHGTERRESLETPWNLKKVLRHEAVSRLVTGLFVILGGTSSDSPPARGIDSVWAVTDSRSDCFWNQVSLSCSCSYE